MATRVTTLSPMIAIRPAMLPRPANSSKMPSPTGEANAQCARLPPITKKPSQRCDAYALSDPPNIRSTMRQRPTRSSTRVIEVIDRAPNPAGKIFFKGTKGATNAKCAKTNAVANVRVFLFIDQSNHIAVNCLKFRCAR